MTKKDIIEQFSSIKGLGKTKAELLYNNGFDSLKKIQESKIEKLIKIKGINEKIAKDIKKQVNEIIKIVIFPIVKNNCIQTVDDRKRIGQ